jgi:predicted transglutaminase-like cysteine proteinase
MSKTYDGPIKLKEFKAKISAALDKANVTCEYKLQNSAASSVTFKASSNKPALSRMQIRKQEVKRLEPSFISDGRMITKIERKKINALESQVLDLDYTLAVSGGKTKTLQFFPDITIDDSDFVYKAQTFVVEIELPPAAKKIISSSLSPSKIVRKDGHITCLYTYSDFNLLPILLKWSEVDVDIAVTKTAKLLSENQMEVTIQIQNNQDTQVNNLLIVDDYSGLDVALFPGNKNLMIETPFDKSSRVIHRLKLSLNPLEKKTIKHKFKLLSNKFVLPDTNVYLVKDLVAIGRNKTEFRLPLPFPPPSCAFALPSGWSFDFLHGGDHHINEVGIWSSGNTYNRLTQQLSWSTGCIYADKNFDDDYRWSVNHQVVRFNPGFAYNEQTPWLAKTGNTTVHDGVFRHESLKMFSKAIVLLAGWRFDFTSEDHHINKIALNIGDIVFNKNAGEVKWKTRVTYADKNFDDNYRYQYSFIILGFNGEVVFKSCSGTDKGGTTLLNHSVTDNKLKGHLNSMIFPLGWSFDFKNDDHHINEFSFRILNSRYHSPSGKVSWQASLNYSDKNFDDSYDWAYNVAVVTSNFGESRDITRGPYTDNGGLDTKPFTESLNGIFRPITWINGLCDGDETGVDCGGSSPSRNLAIISNNVSPGNAASSNLFSLKNSNDLNTVRTFALAALLEYAVSKNQDFTTFYSGVTKPDRYVEAVAAYVNNHMEYVSDGIFGGAQSAIKTLTDSGHRGPGDFNGDCEDHAILRAALLRSLGFPKNSIYCTDHHNSTNQGQNEECFGDKKGSGGHTFNVVIYKGKYRIMDYGPMQERYLANKQAWNQHVVDNIWNDHTGEHWSKQNVKPFGSNDPLVNYPGNPSCPSSNWDWRTYFSDVTL